MRNLILGTLAALGCMVVAAQAQTAPAAGGAATVAAPTASAPVAPGQVPQQQAQPLQPQAPNPVPNPALPNSQSPNNPNGPGAVVSGTTNPPQAATLGLGNNGNTGNTGNTGNNPSSNAGSFNGTGGGTALNIGGGNGSNALGNAGTGGGAGGGIFNAAAQAQANPGITGGFAAYPYPSGQTGPGSQGSSTQLPGAPINHAESEIDFSRGAIDHSGLDAGAGWFH